MSLSVVPDIVSSASGSLDRLGLELRKATATAASRTIAIAAPALDEVSEAITALFGMQAQEFQTVSTMAAAFHDNFVSLLNGGVAQYVSAEAANVEQTLAKAVNASAQALLGHPPLGIGERTMAAAANPAETISQSFPIGPFEAFFGGTAIPTPTGGLVVNNDVGIRLNTPLGSLVLFSEGGGVTTYPETFSYLATGHFQVPFVYYQNAALYTLPSFAPRWVGFTINGVELGLPLNPPALPTVSISWLGTPFYGILPRIGYSPVV